MNNNKLYKDNTVYIVGHGKTSSDNAITSNFKIFFIGIVVDTATDRIIDLECTGTISITNKFVRHLFLGEVFDKHHSNIEEKINRRYFGSSQKALIVAYKDAQKKYFKIKEKYY